MFRKFYIGLTLTTALLSPDIAYSANRTWDAGAGNSDWFNAVNWSSNLQPTDVDNAYININSGVNLSVASAEIVILNLGQAAATNGTLTIDNGGELIAGSAYLGGGTGSTGVVNITGADSYMEVSSIFRVGNGTNSVGTLNILNGGSLNTLGNSNTTHSVGSTSTINISGAGSSWDNGAILNLGFNGDSSLNILDGGRLTTLNFFSSRLGTANVSTLISGTGSQMNITGNFNLGLTGTATLIVEDNAVLNTAIAVWVGSGSSTDANANGTVTVDNAQWILGNNTFRVGGWGKGIVNIENGAQVTNGTGNVYVGTDIGSTGTVNISGNGSLWQHNSTDHTSIGERGTGTLNISDGGKAEFADLYIAGDTGNGTINVTGAGSSIEVAETLIIGSRGTAVLTISDNAVVNAESTVSIALQAGSSATLNIGAAAGDAASAAGTLQAERIVFGEGTGSIIFNHTDNNYVFTTNLIGNGAVEFISGTTNLSGDNSNFTGVISGTSDLVVSSGTTTIDSDSSGYNGDMFITGGVLSMNGTLNNTVTASGTGRIQGNGSFNTLIIDNGGTLAPGNSIGTTNVINATFNPGSNYEVELNSAGQSDLLNATGTVTINGGNVEAIPFPDYALDTPYTIVTAAGGVGGIFDSSSDNFMLFDGILSYDANNVYLTLVQSAMADAIAQTPNQRAINSGLFGISGSNEAVRAYYRLSSAEEARNALDQLSGEIHPAISTAMINDTRRVYHSLPSTPDNVPIGGMSRAWMTGLGSIGRTKSTANTASIDQYGGGVLAGIEHYNDNGGRYGFGFGASTNKLDIKERASKADLESYHVIAYAEKPIKERGLTASGGLTASTHGVNASRQISFDGFNENSNASYRGHTVEARLGLHQEIELKTPRTTITPYVEASVTAGHAGSFDEDGDAGLQSEGQWDHAGALTIGADYARRFKIQNTPAKLTIGLGYQHGIGNTQSTRDMQFQDQNAQRFTTQATGLDRHSALIKTGIDFKITETSEISVSYSGKISDERHDQSLNAALKLKF